MGESTLSSRYTYTELLCDSNAATGAFAGTSSTSWPRFYFQQEEFHTAGIKVISADIPFVFDSISSDNNTFYLTTVSNGTVLMTIAPLTYNGPSLATALATTLNSTAPAGFTVTWNSVTSRFTITGPEAFTITMPTKSPKLNLGFPLGASSSTGFVLVSPLAAIPTGPLYLYVNSQTLGPSINSHTPDDAQQVNQICKISVNAQPGGAIFYNDPNPTQFFDIGPNEAHAFDLYLTLGNDQEQVPLDMKGVGFNVTLGLLNYREAGAPITARPARINFVRP